jgi:hypothetical protein
VCTTIRPSKLFFSDLYDHATCIAFVADFLKYIPPRSLGIVRAELGWKLQRWYVKEHCPHIRYLWQAPEVPN